MWHDATALRKVSNTLFGLSALLALVGVLYYVIHLPVFALRAVQLTALPRHVDLAQVEAVVHTRVRGNFFTVDLAQVRHAFEQLPWVRHAEVRRLFPWQLEVTLEEHEPLARWNGIELVNVQGEVFVPNSVEEGVGLPVFSGPDDLAAEVAQNYARFNALLEPLGRQLAQLTLSPRGAWQLQLQDGMVLELGRERMEERLARFVAAFPSTLAQARPPVRHVDLRYRDGFAAVMAG